MYYGLGYYLINGVPEFKSDTQVEILQQRGHKVVSITEEEFYLKATEYWNIKKGIC
jgi:hypothetical protein